jgi:integrase
MPLSDTAIRNAKAKDTPYKLADEKGLYALINQAGKYWRFDYRFEGKRKTLAFGVYPDVPLKDAREKRDEARRKIAAGIDPGAERKATKTAQAETFEAIAREWFEKVSRTWTAGHAENVLTRLEQNIFPWLGARPIRDITAPDLLTALRRTEERGAPETARRLRQTCGQILAYGIATGRNDRNPASDLRGALPPASKKKHHASITEPKAIGGLLRAIESYQGGLVTKAALKLAPLVFVRPGELRGAEWSEFNLEAAEWRIHAERMKMREQHIVPLSRQAVAILRELHPLTGNGRFLFPGERTRERPMSNNTILGALRRMGYAKDEMTGHGFRSMASTLLNEQGWHRDAIERQLAHSERDAVRAAYNYAEHLPERRKMMQAWADYLDGLKNGAEVIPFPHQSAG